MLLNYWSSIYIMQNAESLNDTCNHPTSPLSLSLSISISQSKYEIHTKKKTLALLQAGQLETLIFGKDTQYYMFKMAFYIALYIVLYCIWYLLLYYVIIVLAISCMKE